jgi:hypothetical protein
MPEIDYAALAAQAIQIKPAAEWECQALQCHFPIGYRDALHVMLILRPEEDQIISTEPIAPATAEGQPHEFDTDGTPGDAGRPDAPLGWHYGTRGASKGKLVRDVAPKPAAAKPKPTAPELAVAVAPVTFSVPLMLGVDISTENGQRDVMALVAIWLSNERDDDVASLLASLLRKLVAAEAKLAALTTPAA